MLFSNRIEMLKKLNYDNNYETSKRTSKSDNCVRGRESIGIKKEMLGRNF